LQISGIFPLIKKLFLDLILQLVFSLQIHGEL
jgi:hypothetical protein